MKAYYFRLELRIITLHGFGVQKPFAFLFLELLFLCSALYINFKTQFQLSEQQLDWQHVTERLAIIQATNFLSTSQLYTFLWIELSSSVANYIALEKHWHWNYKFWWGFKIFTSEAKIEVFLWMKVSNTKIFEIQSWQHWIEAFNN